MSPLWKGVLLTILAKGCCFGQHVVTNERESGGAGLNLRQAINQADNGEIVSFSAELSSKIIEISQGEIVISKMITIEGPGTPNLIKLQGNQSSRLFRVEEGGELILRFLDISRGNAWTGNGGGILNEGILNIEDSRFSQCESSSGGAIFNQGQATLADCTFAENSSSGEVFGGGAIYNGEATLVATGCVFTTNQTDGSGGAISNAGNLIVLQSSFCRNRSLVDGAAIYNEVSVNGSPIVTTVRRSLFAKNESNSDSGALHLSIGSEAFLENCTLAENFAWDGGGAIENSQGTLTLSACTIAGNKALHRGGGLFTLGETTLKNCLLSKNKLGNDYNDLERLDFPPAIFIPVGANLIEEPGNSTIEANINPEDGLDLILPGPASIYPLGFYGGPTQTMPPTLNSPALNAAIDSTLDEDQRGYPRYADSFPDIGGVEFLGVFNEIYLDSDFDGLPNGVEIVTGSDPLVADPEHPGHLRLIQTNQSPTLTFGYDRATSSRYRLRILRSTDLINEVEILSSSSTFIPNSLESPYHFIDPDPPEGHAFYRLEVLRR